MKKMPQRTCMGCNTKKDKKDLIRIVKNKDGEINIDKTGKMQGRGAYLCNNIECLKTAIKTKRLEKVFEQQIDNDIYVLSNEIYKASDSLRIEYVTLRFLKKFSTYFNKSNVLEEGLMRIIYSNKSVRKNISSKLLVYFFKPLLLIKYIISPRIIGKIINPIYPNLANPSDKKPVFAYVS